VSGENSRPEAKTGIVADFDIGEAEVDGLAEEGGAVGGAIGVPAGGEGEGGRGHQGMSFAKRGVGAKGFFWEGGGRAWRWRGNEEVAESGARCYGVYGSKIWRWLRSSNGS
jgi:hypothetical protein